jgi:hypothetical protein
MDTGTKPEPQPVYEVRQTCSPLLKLITPYSQPHIHGHTHGTHHNTNPSLLSYDGAEAVHSETHYSATYYPPHNPISLHTTPLATHLALDTDISSQTPANQNTSPHTPSTATGNTRTCQHSLPTHPYTPITPSSLHTVEKAAHTPTPTTP